MDQVQTKRRFGKPLGLYIITVFDFLAVGLIPLLTVVVELRESEVEYPFWAVLIYVALPVFVMATSVWAWIGDNAARYLLLGLVTLLGVLWIINSLFLLLSEEASRVRVRPVAIIVRATFWIAINWWYFNRAHVVRFFKQNS